MATAIITKIKTNNQQTTNTMETTTNTTTNNQQTTNTMETTFEVTTNNEVYTTTKQDYELIQESWRASLQLLGKSQARADELEAELNHMRETYGSVIDGEAGARGKVDAYEDNAFSMLRTITRLLANQVGTKAVMDAVIESVDGDVADEYMIAYGNEWTTAHDMYEVIKRRGLKEELAQFLYDDGALELEWDMVDNYLDENWHRVCSDVQQKFEVSEMIDFVFDNASERDMFDRVHDFVSELNDSDFRRIVNG